MTQLDLFPVSEMENLHQLQQHKDENDLIHLLRVTDSFTEFYALSHAGLHQFVYDKLKKQYQCPESKT